MAFGLHNEFNIWLAHRHFELSPGERIVEVRNQKLSVSSVFRGGEPDATLFHEYELKPPCSLQSIVPDTFLVENSGLLPLEYVCVDSTEAQKLVTGLSVVSASFLASWRDILQEHGVLDRFGVVLKSKTDSAGIEKLQLCYAIKRVDITLDSVDELGRLVKPIEGTEAATQLESCGDGIPAAWEVQFLGVGTPSSVQRERRCWEVTVCVYCGSTVGQDGRCKNPSCPGS